MTPFWVLALPAGHQSCSSPRNPSFGCCLGSGKPRLLGSGHLALRLVLVHSVNSRPHNPQHCNPQNGPVLGSGAASWTPILFITKEPLLWVLLGVWKASSPWVWPLGLASCAGALSELQAPARPPTTPQIGPVLGSGATSWTPILFITKEPLLW